jgi:hypothetical protein
MKETRSILNSLVACGVALAMVSTLAAQTTSQGAAKVVRLKGAVRYSTGNNVWQALKVGDVVRPGSVIQTAADSRVDLVLGEASPAGTPPVPSDMISYQPVAEQNMVRVWENTLLGVDKLTQMSTGVDVVTETQLDMKAGHITGSVKKMSAASKYEVKLPNGVAGIKGTIFDLFAEGIIKVLEGSIVVAYTGPNGSVLTQLIMTLQMFDTRTGMLSSLPDLDRTGMRDILHQLQAMMLAPSVMPGGFRSPEISPIVSLIHIQPVPVEEVIPPPVSRF